MTKIKLSRKYQIVIPKEVRNKLRLQAGAIIAMYPLDEQRAVIYKHPKSYADALQGLGKELWQKLGGADKYIREERASWRRKSV